MNPDELTLVKRAIQEAQTTTGCCEWKDSAARLILRDARLQKLGLNPKEIKKRLVEFVCLGGDQHIIQIPEKREFDREYYYKVILPIPEFEHGLFVELELVDDDPEMPAVLMVSAHEQRVR